MGTSVKLATSGGLVTFMREQLGKPIPSPVVLGQMKVPGRRQRPRPNRKFYQFDHRKGKTISPTRCVGNEVCGTGLSSWAWRRKKRRPSAGRRSADSSSFTRDKTVSVNHYYFYIDDIDFGPLFLEGVQLCAVGNQALPEWTRMGQAATGAGGGRLRSAGQGLSILQAAGKNAQRSVIRWDRRRSIECSGNG